MARTKKETVKAVRSFSTLSTAQQVLREQIAATFLNDYGLVVRKLVNTPKNEGLSPTTTLARALYERYDI